MIEQELIFLGLLKEGPKHGYDIKLKIHEILSLFTGISFKSIYYPLRILEKKGFIIKRTTKLGRRPARNVYYLTSRGQKRFEELLNKSFLELKRPQFSLDLSLYFLHHMQPEVARRRLKGRAQILNKIAGGLEQMIKSQSSKQPALNRILEHNLQMVKAEQSFLDTLTNTL
jgi:DNA-binding PadR family transcriptional regulator